MNNKTKKIIGGVFAALILSSVGAVLVSANEDVLSSFEDSPETDEFRQWRFVTPRGYLAEVLTDDQKEELRLLHEEMIEQNATCEQIREAVHDLLESWGIDHPDLDEQLEVGINRTSKRFEILNRTQELREEGYSWEEIKEMIQDEFDLPEGPGNERRMRRCRQAGRGQFGPGPCTEESMIV